MNPTVPQDFIDSEFERDPIASAAEYDAQFRSDFDRWLIRKLRKPALCQAQGLAGEAYEGHYFWDTEIYLLPFLTYTSPESPGTS
jgi:hypothetical protein